MSEPVSNVEIEDVLSSIRRLVSAGEKVSHPENTYENQEPASPPKFVLTPALRVTEPADFVESTQADTSTSDETTVVFTDEEDDAVDVPSETDQKQMARESLEATIAELEAAVVGQPDEWELDGSEVTSVPTWETVSYPPLDEVEDAVAIDETPAAEMHSDEEPQTADETTAILDDPWSEKAEDTVADAALDPILDNGPFVPEKAVYTAEDPLPTPEDEDRFADIRNVEALTFIHSQPIQLPEDPSSDEYGDELAPDTAPAGQDEDLEAYVLGDGQGINEEVLRQLVMDVVREELQGNLGERITRNVRKMVRREIHRALDMQDFD